jgi:hypothetical protein
MPPVRPRTFLIDLIECNRTGGRSRSVNRKFHGKGNRMSGLKRIFRNWLPAAVAITGLCGLGYLLAQQALRQSANDPQIQIAEDAAVALEAGDPLSSFLPAETVAVERSLAPFIAVFSDAGDATASSGLLHGELPVLPAGIFDYVRAHGEDRVTWQPEPGLRIAAVVVRFGGTEPGFVLAGRSLREVEAREDNILLLTVVAGIVLLPASLAAAVFGELILGNAMKIHEEKPKEREAIK